MTRAYRPANEEYNTLIIERLAIERPFADIRKQNSIHEPWCFYYLPGYGPFGIGS
jgi:hypothetical protein